MTNLMTKKGVLLDLDGVFYQGDRLIPGADKTLSYLKDRGIPFCFITNTTTVSCDELILTLHNFGLPVSHGQLLTAPRATHHYLLEKSLLRCNLVVSESCLADFPGIENTSDHPDAIVIGDIGEHWHYPLLNSLFRQLIDGAPLIAMHKNKYWQTGHGLQMDIGAFVAALEYVTDTPAVITGKPAKPFFDAALESIGCPAAEAFLVGDDIASDIGAAQQAGVAGVLVKTGKYRDELVARSGIKPDATIDSITNLPQLLGG